MGRRLRSLIVILGATACSESPTSLLIIREHLTEWSTRRPASYQFDYEFFNGFVRPSCTTAVHVVVTGNVVSSATCGTSGQPFLASFTKTVDSVFADALRAEANGTLAQIQYDPTRGYPTLVAVSGPPDASWSEQVTALQAVSTPAP